MISRHTASFLTSSSHSGKQTGCTSLLQSRSMSMPSPSGRRKASRYTHTPLSISPISYGTEAGTSSALATRASAGSMACRHLLGSKSRASSCASSRASSYASSRMKGHSTHKVHVRTSSVNATSSPVRGSRRAPHTNASKSTSLSRPSGAYDDAESSNAARGWRERSCETTCPRSSSSLTTRASTCSPLSRKAASVLRIANVLPAPTFPANTRTAGRGITARVVCGKRLCNARSGSAP
mmetsp:Transcript_10464/g.20957  ORF Transcript_10464/g.20957 Transcript_10464/m.20957 type:complete len:238 (+) Transcript_10464:5513-6226(+)